MNRILKGDVEGNGHGGQMKMIVVWRILQDTDLDNFIRTVSTGIDVRVLLWLHSEFEWTMINSLGGNEWRTLLLMLSEGERENYC